MSTVLKVILGVVGVGVIFIAFFFLVIMNATSGVADAGDAFMNKLKAKDYAGALTMCTPELQTELGGAASVQQNMEAGNLIPTEWSFSSRSINSNSGSNSVGELGGTFTTADGKDHPMDLRLESQNDTWKIVAVSLRQQ